VLNTVRRKKKKSPKKIFKKKKKKFILKGAFMADYEYELKNDDWWVR
jgi:hypothetical protein